jgi:hypothetical protein
MNEPWWPLRWDDRGRSCAENTPVIHVRNVTVFDNQQVPHLATHWGGRFHIIVDKNHHHACDTLIELRCFLLHHFGDPTHAKNV